MITEELVKEVKSHNKRKYHDEKLFKFNVKKDVEAINYALTYSEHDDTNEDIVIRAKDYLRATKNL